MKKVLIDVWNGEGYSEPTIQVVTTKEKYDSVLKGMLESYGNGEVTEMNGDCLYSIDIEEDNGAIYSIDLPKNKISLLKLCPDVCEAKIFETFDTIEEAEKSLSGHVNSPENGYNIESPDEVEEFNEIPMFGVGLHGHDSFDYYQIIL